MGFLIQFFLCSKICKQIMSLDQMRDPIIAFLKEIQTLIVECINDQLFFRRCQKKPQEQGYDIF